MMEMDPFPLCPSEPTLDSFESKILQRRVWFVQVQGPLNGWDVAGPTCDTEIEAITAWNLGMRELQGP